jgi:hypothetical protein
MTKTVGMVLIVLGLIGLAWGGFNYTTVRRSSTSGRFTRLAKRHITSRFRQSREQWRSLVALCCW